MNFDIEYLLFLQGLRDAAPAWVSTFLSFMSEVTISSFCILLPAVIYWCWSKRAGSYLMFNVTASMVINGLVKNTACVYRPWIRDSRVQSTLMKTATGYSFPSGHTTIGVALYGGIGMLVRKYKRVLLFLCFIPAVITGFARNWVGAHTPQDVVCGFVLSLAMLIVSEKLFDMIEKHPDRDIWVTVIGTAFCAAVLLYVCVKPYPLDYTAEGTLLVDPKTMMIDVFGHIGMAWGFLLGWLLERRWVKFRTDVPALLRVIRAGIGIIAALLISKGLRDPLTACLGAHFGKMAYYFVMLFFITGIYPLCYQAWEKRLPFGARPTGGTAGGQGEDER